MQPSTTAAARQPRASVDRSAAVPRPAALAGAAGLAFLVLIAVQNLLKAASRPAICRSVAHHLSIDAPALKYARAGHAPARCACGHHDGRGS
jgi:hypothetical protein